MARACIFCSSTADLNQEDLWPKWLVKLVVQDRPSQIERVLGSEDVPFIYGGKWVKGRGVCQQCNSGWMSDLETSVSPVLAPLIFDSSSPLDFIQQSGIAMWALKTAMAFECVTGAANIDQRDPDAAFYSAADRQHLMKWRTPPPDSFVWIGRYGEEFSLWIQNDRVSNAQPENILSKGSVTTFAMGRFLIQVLTAQRALSSNNETQTRRIRIDKGLWDDALIPIWPAPDNPVRWPPAQSVMGLDNLDKLARRFGRQRSSVSA
jgi:hypothetical protein